MFTDVNIKRISHYRYLPGLQQRWTKVWFKKAYFGVRLHPNILFGLLSSRNSIELLMCQLSLLHSIMTLALMLLSQLLCHESILLIQ